MGTLIGLVLALAPALGAIAIIALAQLRVRPLSQQAALALTIGGAVELAVKLAAFLLPQLEVHLYAPVFHVLAVGAVVFGLITLQDELNPPKRTALPGALAMQETIAPNLFLRGFFGFWGLAALGTNLRFGVGPALVMGALGIFGALYGSVWLEKQGSMARWVLERKPELVVWSFVHQLTVVNRRYGTRSVHWSAQLALESGASVGIPATNEDHARELVGAIAALCPGIALGHSPELVAKFQIAPASLRGTPPARS